MKNEEKKKTKTEAMKNFKLKLRPGKSLVMDYSNAKELILKEIFYNSDIFTDFSNCVIDFYNRYAMTEDEDYIKCDCNDFFDFVDEYVNDVIKFISNCNFIEIKI